MPHILHNPAFESMPDYEHDVFAPFRQAIMNTNNITEDEAIAQLVQMWITDIAERQALWAEQQNEEWLQAEEAKQLARQAQEDENRCLATEADRLRNEQDAQQTDPITPISGTKKKIRLIPYADTAPCDSIAARPSPYTISKLEAFEFIDLYYFTSEGLEEAAASLQLTADNIFGIEKVNSMLTLRSFSSSTAS
jgi:multidrug efflux pump subunit AcrA (membrane-fusion protein)